MPKVVLIGLDAAVPSLARKYMTAGDIPNISKLASNGAWSEIMPVFPTHTAANWNTVSTGATPGVHGVTDMVVKMPGKPLTEVVSGFYSDLCKAEQLWKTAERNGRKVMLMKYIGSWPPTISSGYQVEGFGAPGGPGSRPWGSSPLALANASCFSTVHLENANVITFDKLQGETGGPQSGGARPTLQATISIGGAQAIGPKFTVTVLSPQGEGQDTELVVDLNAISESEPGRGGKKEIRAHLQQGETSDWIFADFSLSGKIVAGYFRFTLVGLGPDPVSNFKLYVSQVFPIEGWTFPKELARELVEENGPFIESISHFPYVFGWIDEKTYLSDVEYQANWIGASTRYLMGKYPWDLYMTQWHGIDNTQHAFLRFDKSVLSASEAATCDYVTKRSYQIADNLVRDIFLASHAGVAENNAKVLTDQEARAENDVYTIIMSDHGHVMGKRRFFINGYFYQKGLIRLKRDESTKKVTIDWSRTVAYAQGMVHVFVNLKGRDPEGCVEPGKEYDHIVTKIIDLLYDAKDPKTAVRPIALALGNKNAEFLGLSGERSGDVIIAADPVYALDNRVKTTEDIFEDLRVKFPDGSIHGSQLPSVDLGEFGTTNAMFVCHGPRIKKGYVRDRPMRMIDIAPTISHLLGIPAPLHSEGTVVHDIMD